MEVRWWGKNCRSRKMWKVSSHGSRLCGLSAFVTWRCYKRNWSRCQLRSHHCNWFITSICGANCETSNSPSRRCLNRTSQRAKTLPRQKNYHTVYLHPSKCLLIYFRGQLKVKNNIVIHSAHNLLNIGTRTGDK